MKQPRTDRISIGFFTAFGVVCLCVLLSTAPPIAQVAADFEPAFQAIRSLIGAGRYADAEVEAESLSLALQGVASLGPLEVARGRDQLVEALVRNGKGADPVTRQLADQVIHTKEAQVGRDHLILAPSLRNLGDVLIAAGDYQEAIAPYKRALAIHELGLGQNSAELADDLDHLAEALRLTGDSKEALATADRALAIKEKIFKSDDIRIARSLEIQGLILLRRGEYARSRVALERALTLREREARNDTSPEMASTLSLLGEQSWAEGDLIQARAFSTRAVAIAERTVRPDHPDLASHMRTLALPIQDLGDSAAARRLREHALSIAEKSLGLEHPLIAMQLNDLANSFILEGDYSNARRSYERALRIYERRLGSNHSLVATEVFNLALLDTSMGDFVQARREFNRAAATWSRVYGPDHLFVARATQELAAMLSDQGLYSKARPLYERTLAIRERKLGPIHHDVAETLSTLSTTLARLGEVEKGYELSARALGIWEQSAPVSWGAADAFANHGMLQMLQSDYDGATRSFDHALAIRRQIFGPSHPAVAEVQASRSMALARLGQRAEALRAALDAEQIGRDHLRLTLRYLSERQALAYAAKRPKGFDLALSLSSKDRESISPTFDALIRGRALTLDEMATRRHRAADAAQPDVAPLWTALISARQRFANLVVRGPSEQRPEQYLALIEDARREKELAERALAEKSAAFRAEAARVEVGLEQVGAALPAGSALVSFVRYDRTIIDDQPNAPLVSGSTSSVQKAPRSSRTTASYLAFVLRSGESEPFAVPIGSAASLETLIAEWRLETTAGIARSADSPQSAEQSLRVIGTKLRQRVWDPIAMHLTDVSRVIVVPDGALNLVPLAALPVGRTDYLLEKGPTIHYLSTERDSVSAGESFSTGRGLLAVGGPAFDEGALFAALSKKSASRVLAESQAAPSSGVPTTLMAQQSSPQVATATAPFRGARSSCGNFQSLLFAPLPGSQREAKEVADLWQEYGPDGATAVESLQALAGRDANERAFKQLAPGSRVLHLATHGFFLESDCASAPNGTRSVGALAPAKKNKRVDNMENPLLLSGLALAGANRRAAAGPDEDDGILTAEEVSALNLEGVEWAVLSACDTGLGEVKAGEGVFGLRRAFQVAGVRTVIMSLWPVDDQATRIWMRALYQGRLQKRLSTADAMHQASLSVLRERRARHQSTHPFYWAAFVAAGDWR